MADSRERIADLEGKIADYESRIATLEREIEGYVISYNEARNRHDNEERNFYADFIPARNEILKSYFDDLKLLRQEKNTLISAPIVALEYPCELTFHFESITRTFDDEILVLDVIPKEFVDRYTRYSISRPIYIRKCYKELYDLATAAMIQRCDWTPGILFTGVPGIGKSMFLIYFLCRFQTDPNFINKSFAFEVERGVYHYYRATGIAQNRYSTTAQFTCSRSVADAAIPLNDILVVADISDKVEPKRRAKWTLIFSSPNPDRYKEFMKYQPTYTYIVPTWSDYELWCVDGNIDQWHQRYLKCGGVPRLVFWDQQGNDPSGAIDLALSEKGSIIGEFFFTHGFGDVDKNKSYSLIHINPPSGENSLKYLCDPSEIVYSFASHFIFETLQASYTTGLITKAAGFFNVGSGVASAMFGPVSAGVVFEKICLWLVPLADKQISIVPLSPPQQSLQGNTSISVQLPPLEKLAFNLKKSQDLKDGVLYQPLTSNLESGDAFCVIEMDNETILIVLQITVGAKHPIKANGLTTIVNSYPENIRSRIKRKLLVFVTPVSSQLSEVQPIHIQGNTVISRFSPEARNFEQYVYRHLISK